MKYAFIEEHRPLFSIRAMCHVLRVHPSGFYAWLKHPLSKRAIEDKRQGYGSRGALALVSHPSAQPHRIADIDHIPLTGR